MLVTRPRQRSVSGPIIRADRTARYYCLAGKTTERLLGSVRNDAHSESPDTLLALVLHGYHHKGLSQRSTASFARFLAAHIGFVHLHRPVQPISTRSHHRTTQFVQPRPSRLVTAQFQDPLDTFGARPILLAHYPPDRTEPNGQRLTRAFKDRTGDQRRFVLACRASQKPSRAPRFARTTTGTAKAIGPAESGQVLSARILCGKTPIEFSEISGVIIHSPRTLHIVATPVKWIPQFTIFTILNLE